MKIRFTSHALPRDEGQLSSDSVSVVTWESGFLAALADGAGSHPAAREAATRAVTLISTHYKNHPLSWSPGKALREAVRLVNRTLWNESIVKYERPEMVSTLVVLLYDEGRLTTLSIGDSRIYRLRQDQLVCLTTDDVDKKMSLRLIRALGSEETLNVTSSKVSLEEGDTYLLCSDGIHHHLSDERIAESMKSKIIARQLAKIARDESPEESRDDCAAICIQVESLGWVARREEHQLPIPAKLSSGDSFDGWTLLRSFGANDRCWLTEREGCRQVMKFAPAEAFGQPLLAEVFLKETWNAIRFAEDKAFVKAWENPVRSSLYYNMEFVNAPGLATFIKQRKLQIDESVKLGIFLAEACIRLLRHDLLHGDIKPENILIGVAYDDLFFKLIDLGLSCEVFSHHTRAGTACYLAPERFQNAPISECSEIFSIGVSLYEVLTNRLPFGHIERFQTPSFSDPKAASSINPLVPPWLDAILQRACAIKPERRYTHFSELLFDLNNPQKVRPWHSEHTPLMEKNPLLFWKIIAIFFTFLSAILLFFLMR
jgi:serine/threonine protein phosphatase PrpC